MTIKLSGQSEYVIIWLDKSIAIKLFGWNKCFFQQKIVISYLLKEKFISAIIKLSGRDDHH